MRTDLNAANALPLIFSIALLSSCLPVQNPKNGLEALNGAARATFDSALTKAGVLGSQITKDETLSLDDIAKSITIASFPFYKAVNAANIRLRNISKVNISNSKPIETSFAEANCEPAKPTGIRSFQATYPYEAGGRVAGEGFSTVTLVQTECGKPRQGKIVALVTEVRYTRIGKSPIDLTKLCPNGLSSENCISGSIGFFNVTK